MPLYASEEELERCSSVVYLIAQKADSYITAIKAEAEQTSSLLQQEIKQLKSDNEKLQLTVAEQEREIAEMRRSHAEVEEDISIRPAYDLCNSKSTSSTEIGEGSSSTTEPSRRSIAQKLRRAKERGMSTSGINRSPMQSGINRGPMQSEINRRSVAQKLRRAKERNLKEFNK